MTLKTHLTRLLIAEGHSEPVGRVDAMNGVGQPVEDFAAESRAEVTTPKGARR